MDKIDPGTIIVLKAIVDRARANRQRDVMVTLTVNELAALIEDEVHKIRHCDKSWNRRGDAYCA